MSDKQKIVPKEEEFVSKRRVLISLIVVLMAILTCFFILSEQRSTPFAGYIIIISISLAAMIFIYEFQKFKSIHRSIQSSGSHEYVDSVNGGSVRSRAIRILMMGAAFLLLTLLPFYMVAVIEPIIVFALIISGGLGLNLGVLIFFCYLKWWEKRHKFSLIKRVFRKNGVRGEMSVWDYRVVEGKNINRKEKGYEG